MADKTLEDAIIIGIVGFGIWEMHNAYCRCAPPMNALRCCNKNDTNARQALMDADIHIGGLAFFGGGVASLFLRSWWPILIVAAAFLYTSWCHHDTLQGPTPMDLDSIATGANSEWSTQPTL